MTKLKAIVKEQIKITVSSTYLPLESDPDNNQYAFSYQVRIQNDSPIKVQLMRRHWIITDANAETSQVDGVGVVGEQPIIPPNQHYVYTSGVILSTPIGSMHGNYQMQQEDGHTFNVIIPAFGLAVAAMVH